MLGWTVAAMCEIMQVEHLHLIEWKHIVSVKKMEYLSYCQEVWNK